MTLSFGIVGWVSLGMAAYVYAGYYLTLWVLARFSRRAAMQWQRGGHRDLPSVTVIVAAYNEAATIQGRLEDLSRQNYPRERLEGLVCSDGSTESTAVLPWAYKAARVRVLDFPRRRGRGAVHNEGVKEATGEIVVFTDADTRFRPDTLRELMAPFENPRVGCAVGHLIFRGGGSGVAGAEGAYWRYELKIRALESNLGMLATGTGACMAVRRSLFRPLQGVADVDCVIPLDCIGKGYEVVYVPQAIAYDLPSASPRAEFRSRRRMTSRDLKATLASLGPRQWVRHPRVTWGLLSHKVLRWLSPFLLMLALASTSALAFSSGVFALLLVVQVVGYLLALVGGMAAWAGRSVPVASLSFSFLLSNVAIGVGVVQALLGKAPLIYERVQRTATSGI